MSLTTASTAPVIATCAENSHSMKPWLYKFAGAWGNHEGSMLLWVTVLAIAGAAVAQPAGQGTHAGAAV